MFQPKAPVEDTSTVTGMLARAHQDNMRAAAAAGERARNDNREMEAFRARLRDIGARLPVSDRIPALHFVYGLKQVEEFPFYALISVLSAQAYHPGARTFFFLHHEPVGPYWEILKERVEIIKVPNFEWCGVAQYRHYAHKSDIVRMLVLHEIGGLYLDCDTITLRSMDDLWGHDYVMGVQQTIATAMGGFCNAIMISKRHSAFGAYWIDQYKSFNSKGRDLHWDFHSVKLPMYLYSVRSEGVRVLPHDKWFFPLWNHIYSVMFTTKEIDKNRQLFDGQYAVHLWHNMIASTLDAWSPLTMAQAGCLYAEMCLDALAALPAESRAAIMQKLSLDSGSLGGAGARGRVVPA
jgi:hypothetical protein